MDCYRYGEQTTTPYTVTTSQKGTTSTTAYTIGTDYIYFENNGTSTFYTGYGTSGRYKFDDIHFEFFADAAGSVPVGTTSPGYIPDKIAGKDVYKIAIPDGAAYFRVNNGEKSTPSATVNNTRQSEIFKITPNGLYKFVEDADAQKVWGNAAASSIAELDDQPYKIKDDFTATGTYIKLATVVTGDDGKQEYIKANSLKRKGTEGADANTVDDEYLSHTVADEGQTAGGSNGNPGTGIKVVKVKKKATITSVGDAQIAADANNDGTPDNDTYEKVYYYWKETVAPAGYKLPDSGEEYTIVDTTTTDADHHYDSTDSVYRPTVKDESIAGGKVTLTKTAKEKVGTTDIGSPLAGAEFKLVKLLADGTEDTTVIKFKQDTENTDGSYTTSSSGTFNSYNNTPADTSDDKWLVTGSDGKLVLNNVPIGSYYLEEMKAPAGYSNLESDGTTKKKVYFSIGKIGDVVPDKEITMADEMAPAYIKLYEHINEKLDAWGDPTFVFKITQTQYYDSGGNLQAVTSSKTQLVALTVDDNVLYSAGLTYHSNPDYNYRQWLEESTTEAEYKGMYHIDGQGRIRLEPGTYQISRIPVSRYKFVENTYCMADDENTSTSYTTHRTSNEVLTVTVPVSKTAIVHYYDKVDYYDKFSQVDTKVNKFYTLDSTTKENRTIKGIRVEDYRQTGSGTPSETFIPDTFASNDSTDMEVANSRLKAYFIYADGSEAEITDKDNLSISYVSNDNKVNGTGVTLTGFSYDTENHKMKVENANDHASERYTLTATYTFTGTDPPPDLITKFDLVFKVAES